MPTGRKGGTTSSIRRGGHLEKEGKISVKGGGTEVFIDAFRLSGGVTLDGGEALSFFRAEKENF